MAEYTEPYALILKSHATNNTLTPFYNALPKGSNTVSITWDGPEKLNIFTAPEQSAVTRKNIAEIPAGTGRRSVMLSNIGVDDGETVLIGAYTPTLSVGRRATVVVVNLPLKTGGGGVGFLSLPASWWAGGRSESPDRIYGSFHPDPGYKFGESINSGGAAPAGRIGKFPANPSRSRDLHGDDRLGWPGAGLSESVEVGIDSSFYSAGEYQVRVGPPISVVQAGGEPAGHPAAVDLQSAGIHGAGGSRYRCFGDSHRRVAQGVLV